ncbi:MAG TPA: CocE/NonD family hydrolase [Steroidobacteraceae bacterium]|nr:CocE/NonD family hydrolase [Steroidobacteraceae bacterium]
MTKTPTSAGRIAAMRAAKSLIILLFTVIVQTPSRADAPDLEFHPPAAAGDAATPAIMRDLAERILPVYEEADPDRYLANLSALQLVTGNYAAADVSRQALRDRRRRVDAGKPAGRAAIFDIYAYAKALEAEDRVPFADGFTRSFREVAARLNDHDAYAVTRLLEISPAVHREELQKSFDQQRTTDRISQSDAVDLIWKYLSFDAYRSFGSLIGPLVAEDDSRRYTGVDELLIKTADGAGISVLVIRPKGLSKPMPSLLEFTIYDVQNYARECAAHGYAGVVAYTRGKHSNYPIVPYQYDGDDARAVINWIAKQPWSDGRVGMYGDGYSGFTPWAAAKRLPPALKAIAVSAPSAPGVDVPMGGGIFQNSAYRWSSYVTDTKAAEQSAYYDDAPWRALDQKWYKSGRRYRDLGRLNGKPNPIFIRWLNHPSYDKFWQDLVPYREQFARINIPVLTITGYYAGSEPGALYYFTQHHRYNPHADHRLIIGPYDDTAMQRGPMAMLQRYQVDSAALIDLRELRYQWFDHVLKGAALPDLLNERVNYELMGANEWRHAASLEAMAKGSSRYYLDVTGSGDRHRLSQRKITRPAVLRQTVSLTDRRDFAWTAPADFISRRLTTHNSVMFVSEPLTKTTEFNGLVSGRLDFTVNKMDLDLNVTLYELLPGGDYIYLFNPTYEFRASYARDRAVRHLLHAGERQELIFKSERMTSRRLQPGSRLVMILGVNKRPDREINYGTGTDVSEETIADGKPPIRIQWYNDSYIDIPIRR